MWRGESIFMCESNSADDEAFIAYASAHFQPQWYLETYPDVAEAGVDPLSHWLDSGLWEGRLPGPNIALRRSADGHRLPSGAWKRFMWRGESIALKARQIPDAIISQIMAQGHHEPAVLAAGSLALPLLPHLEAVDLYSRDGVNSDSILSAVPDHPEIVFIIPQLATGDVEKYAASIVHALLDTRHRSILVFVTEQTAVAAGNWREQRALTPFQSAHIVFWQDICGPSYRDPTALARLLNALRPAVTIVADSRVGLEMVAKFGRGLSQFSRLCCIYLGSGVRGRIAPYNVRFHRQTAAFSLTLTNSEAAAKVLRDRHGEIMGLGIAILPYRVQPIDDRIFATRLAKRGARIAERLRRWIVCLSSDDEQNETTILAELARLRPHDEFALFGTIEASRTGSGLGPPNIFYRGALEDLVETDFGSYDAFISISFRGGMQCTVVEACLHGIPMILADADELRETFNDTAAVFVRPTVISQEAAVSFSAALNFLASLAPAQLNTMLVAARDQALARHATATHVNSMIDLLYTP
ncbi:glycosyltransferase family 4 protein [Microvirga calopogonii]|uniref:glycosyltransferase family 4 protein n=1 Tax=Microvirga calopogonii TaxID=2078013 RepID=UPI0013B3F3C4|nr:glycosyltransferase family 4 protein [Microvirga calopogonii]